MKHKSNIPILPDQDPDSTAIVKKDTREEQLVRNLFLGLDPKQAALKAGYSESFSDSSVYTKFKSKRFQDLIRDYAIANNVTEIPKVCNLYRIAVNQMHKEAQSGDLSNLAKLRHIPRQILEIGRVLAPEAHTGNVTLVNIESLQAIITGKVGTTGNDKEE